MTKEMNLTKDGSFDYTLREGGLLQDLEFVQMNYAAAKLTEYPAESSSVNHSSPQQAAGYSGSRIKKEALMPKALEKMRLAFICEYCVKE